MATDLTVRKPKEMMMSEELKPCPFCGKSEYILVDCDQSGYLTISCDHCGGKMPTPYKDRADAYPAWNTRPGPAAVDQASNPWKAAIIDDLICSFQLEQAHYEDPRKALNDSICWHMDVALDPAVSKDAQALIDKGRASREPAAVDQYKAKYDMLRRHTVPASMAMSMEIELREIRDDESIADFIDDYVQQALLKEVEDD